MKYKLQFTGDTKVQVTTEPEDFRAAEQLLVNHLLQKMDLAKENNLAFYWTDVEFTMLRALLVQRIDHYRRKQYEAEQAALAPKEGKKK